MVAIVILNFKVKAATLKCVKSVLKSDYSSLQVVVVDNNSQDEVKEALPKDNQITFIQTGANLGYTGGNNRGIQEALSLGADYVFVLNPDTEIEKTTVSALIQGIEETKAGIAGPKILFDDRKTIWFAGGLFDSNNILGNHRGVDEEDNGQYDETGETEYVTGGAMMITRQVLEKIGLFDERYFLYYEDSDLCWRAKIAGFKLMYIPSAVVFHANAQSTGIGSPLQDYFITRNRLLFGSKFSSLRTRFALLREALRNVSNPTRRLALFDFLLGRFGKGSFLK